MALLRQAGIELHPWLVQPFAQKLGGGNRLQRWWRRYRLRQAWRAITLELKVLRLSKQGKAQPYDGQLEVFDPPPNWLDHCLTLQNLLIKQPKKTRKKSLSSLFSFTASLYSKKQFSLASTLMHEAIKIEPSSAAAYNNLGALLADDPQRAAEAEQAYRDAIQRDENDAQAYSNLGALLAKNPQRAAEAEQAYRDAILRDENDAAAYGNLASLLRKEKRPQEAIPLLERRIQLQPENFDPLLGLASIHKHLGQWALGEPYAALARQYLPKDDYYNRACLESVCGDIEAAFEHLRLAAAQPNFDRGWAWEDPDFEWIRDDGRFAESVGPKTN